MAPENAMVQVRHGMAVHTSDGHTLGKVERVWYGTDPTADNPRCDEEVCSRLEVHHGVFLRRTAMYVPTSAIAEVAGKHVTLNVDAATVNEHDWIKLPPWIAAAGGRQAEPLDDTTRAAAGWGG